MPVGGPSFVWHLAWTQLYVSGLALAGALAIALPVGLVLGHRGKGELLAVGVGNAGRALPELVRALLRAQGFSPRFAPVSSFRADSPAVSG